MPEQFVIIKHGTLKFALKLDVTELTPLELNSMEFRDLWILATGYAHVFTQEKAERAIEIVNTLPHKYKLQLEEVIRKEPPSLA